VLHVLSISSSHLVARGNALNAIQLKRHSALAQTPKMNVKMLVALKAFVTMVDFVLQYSTGQSASVLQDLLVQDVKLMSMNVLLDLATMVPLVLIYLKDTDVTALKATTDCNVMKRTLIVMPTHVQKEQCAGTNLVLAITLAYVGLGILETAVTSQSTHVEPTHAPMEPSVKAINRAGLGAGVLMVGKEHFVIKTLMTVLNNLAFWVPTVPTLPMTLAVTALLDLEASGVKIR
jgi:hypothetical protein